MIVIGLCGGSGSGKGLVSSIFNDLGIRSIDTDLVYREIISTDSDCTKELISAFGEKIHARPGIDRAELRNIVFSSPERLKLLNDITHKHILSKVRYDIQLEEKTGVTQGIIIDAPLLFESGFDKECDVTICVIADEDIRINRIINRDGLTRSAAEQRVRSQISNKDLIEKCNYSIENNGDISDLLEKVREVKNIIFR